MTDNEKELSIKQQKRKTAAGTLATVGFILMLGAAGTDDYRDTAQSENDRLGHEVYSYKDVTGPRTTSAMLWGGALALIAAAGLTLKNQKER